MNFNLIEIVLEKDDLHFLLSYLLDSIEQFIRQYFYVCLPIQYEIEDALIKWLVEEGVVADI
jgi:hypothetical protein